MSSEFPAYDYSYLQYILNMSFTALHSLLHYLLGLHRSPAPAPARIRRFFQIRQKSGSGQNSAGAGCYCWMLKMRTSNANSIFRTKIPGVSHRSLFCLHSTDVYISSYLLGLLVCDFLKLWCQKILQLKKWPMRFMLCSYVEKSGSCSGSGSGRICH